MIAKMLSNKVYTGSMVQRKTVTSYYEGKECKKLPEEKWIIIPDCHEAIIGREQFERVNAMKRKPHRTRKPQPVSRAATKICLKESFSVGTADMP